MYMDMKRKCNHENEMNRRQFLERLGLGSATALSLMTLGSLQTLSNSPLKGEDTGREVSP